MPETIAPPSHNPTRMATSRTALIDPVNVMVQLAPRRTFRSSFGLGGAVLPTLPHIEWDSSFAPVHIPTGETAGARSLFGLIRPSEPEMIIARGRVSRAALPVLMESVKESPETLAVFSDPPIRPFPVCPNAPAIGDAADVARLLNDEEIAGRGTGEGVAIAVVDTGFDIDYLRKHVQPARMDESVSWSWKGGPKPGHAAVDHGTMCAFDALIGARQATLIDVAVLNSDFQLPQLLSTAVQAYTHLAAAIRRNKLLDRYKALVVTNSWGVYDPTEDVPPGNYIDNPTHAFNVAVRVLVRAGADVVFAAGNCGEECPSEWCNGKTTASIYGANSHPDVVSVAGVTVKKERVGYSSKGPGRLDAKKPDICGYTHFTGSEVEDVDSGTSAAAPVVAGFMAAIRSKYPSATVPPAELKRRLLEGCDHLGRTNHDLDYGWGVVDGGKFVRYIDGQQKDPSGEAFASPAGNDEQSVSDIQ